MEINTKSNAGQNLGIAAVIIGIISFILAIIPCLGMFAIIPGIVAIILGAIGLSQAVRGYSQTGLPIAGLIVALIACLISVSQVFITGELINKGLESGYKYGLKNRIDEIVSELENEGFSIRINKDGNRINIDENTVEIEIDEKMQERLEALEGVTEPGDTLHEE
jgi:hypothetical protein